MPTDKPRITFMVEPELKAEIEEYQFSQRIKNQSQAVLSLIEKGIQSEKDIVEREPSYTADEMELVNNYRAMNTQAQSLIRDISERLVEIAPRETPVVESDSVPGPAGPNMSDEWVDGEFDDMNMDEAAITDIDHTSHYMMESDNDNFDPA